jgi:NAD(P)-dependent dehydrogenase (short-subunit alcohol dehydrogenase family)
VQAITAEGGEAIAAPFDVTDLDAVGAGTRRIREELGPIGILVNNAGVPLVGSHTDLTSARKAGLVGPFKDSDPTKWHAWIDLNLYGSMNCVWSVLSDMVERGWGRIIQISSGSGSRPQTDANGAPIGVSVYGASKAGIEGLLRHVAVEVARDGVTANSLALGLMDNNPETSLLSHVPVGRLGRPAEVGAAVLWLCSEEGGFVTGQTIHLSGGDVLGR